MTAQEAFSFGGTNAFAVIDQMVAAVAAGNQAQIMAGVDQMGTARSTLSSAQSSIGAATNRVTSVVSRNSTVQLSLTNALERGGRRSGRARSPTSRASTPPTKRPSARPPRHSSRHSSTGSDEPDHNHCRSRGPVDGVGQHSPGRGTRRSLCAHAAHITPREHDMMTTQTMVEITTPEGLPGFSDARSWTLETDDDAVFLMLRSNDLPGVALVLRRSLAPRTGLRARPPDAELRRHRRDEGERHRALRRGRASTPPGGWPG